MVNEAVLRKFVQLLPTNMQSLAKKVYYRDRHWAHPSLKRFGTVQDLHYWVSDGNLDTLLLLQNYFSVLYPELETETEGTLTLFSKDGEQLGLKPFSLAHCGGTKLRVSNVLEELQVRPADDFGTLEVNVAIPQEVLERIQDEKSVYFWDRFYIGYTTGQGQTCFVHGIDKTHIFRDRVSEPVSHWYSEPKDWEWAPEIPVDIGDYHKFNVILINRASRTSQTSLVVSDRLDKSLSWSASIPACGVRRFELTREDLAELAPTELRMRVKGMATQFGRPIVFKEFANGAISTMHC